MRWPQSLLPQYREERSAVRFPYNSCDASDSKTEAGTLPRETESRCAPGREPNPAAERRRRPLYTLPFRRTHQEQTMQSRITGTTMPVLEFQLEPNESIISEAGELSWMGSSIQMTTHTQFGGGGGLLGVIKRVAGGGSIFMTEYRAIGAAGELAFATKLPGHIVPVEVSPGHEYMIHRHGFLCATTQIQISVGFQQSLGAGIFGGSGFLLQHLSGQGTAWLELSGELVVRDLQAGETLRVHPGHVGAFQSSVSFNITTVPGIKNMIFGGDGIFLAALTGPGRIWLQTLPIAKLAHAIDQYLPHESRETVEGGMVGGIVGSILDGMKR